MPERKGEIYSDLLARSRANAEQKLAELRARAAAKGVTLRQGGGWGGWYSDPPTPAIAPPPTPNIAEPPQPPQQPQPLPGWAQQPAVPSWFQYDAQVLRPAQTRAQAQAVWAAAIDGTPPPPPPPVPSYAEWTTQQLDQRLGYSRPSFTIGPSLNNFRLGWWWLNRFNPFTRDQYGRLTRDTSLDYDRYVDDVNARSGY
jgi:hypothetical protein